MLKSAAFAIPLAFLVGTAAWAEDMGDTTAKAYRAQHPACVQVPQYSTQAHAVGPVTGDPEQDTIAFDVVQLVTICPENGSSAAR